MPSPRESTACSGCRRGTPGRMPHDAARRKLRDRAGQGTLEYALVLFAFLSMVAGVSAVWHLLEAGKPVEHALQGASHHVSSVAPGAFSDVFMY